jgi:hypothetical protein
MSPEEVQKMIDVSVAEAIKTDINIFILMSNAIAVEV